MLDSVFVTVRTSGLTPCSLVGEYQGIKGSRSFETPIPIYALSVPVRSQCKKKTAKFFKEISPTIKHEVLRN